MADENWKKLFADVAYRRLALEATWRRIVADASYRRLVVGDLSTLAVIRLIAEKFAEAIGVSDGIRLDIGKAISDPVNTGEALTFSLRKSETDAIVVSDGIALSVAQVIGDQATAADALSFSFSKRIDDDVTVVDQLRVGGGDVDVAGSDDAYTADVISLDTSKGFADVLVTTDAVIVALSFGIAPASQLNGFPIGEWCLGE